MKNNTIWRIRNGRSINCLHDIWLPNVGKLADSVLRTPSMVESALRVSDISDIHCGWVFGKLNNLIPDGILQHITNRLSPNLESGEDRIAWRLSTDGGFSNKSAYEFLIQHHRNSSLDLYKFIWNWPGPERGKVLLWKVSQEALVTNLFRWRRGMAESSDCPLCGSGVESIAHLMRDCGYIMQLWNYLADYNLPNDFVSGDLNSWLSSNLCEENTRRGLNWNILFGVALMVVWQARNDFIFQGQTFNVATLGKKILFQTIAIHKKQS